MILLKIMSCVLMLIHSLSEVKWHGIKIPMTQGTLEVRFKSSFLKFCFFIKIIFYIFNFLCDYVKNIFLKIKNYYK